MRTLYLNNGSEYGGFIKKAFQESGCDMDEVLIPKLDAEIVSDFSGELGKTLIDLIAKAKPDFIFSVEYYPGISALCMKIGIPYVSWVLSGAYENVYSATAGNNCNQIYLFDMEMVEKFAKDGITTVRYLPFGVEARKRRSRKYQYEVSFIGSIRFTPSEKEFPLGELKDSTKGYLEGLTAMQRQVYGYDFFENITPGYVLADLKKCCPPELSADNQITPRLYYAEKYFHERVTDVEREINLNFIGVRSTVDLFTDKELAKKVNEEDRFINHKLPEWGENQEIIRTSKVNVNITPRKVRSGITYHAWEILGCGGFLLTDYRAEFYDWFVPEEDLVVCENSYEMCDKAAYFRTHDEKRERIAINGHEKVLRLHGWKSRTDAIVQGIQKKGR